MIATASTKLEPLPWKVQSLSPLQRLSFVHRIASYMTTSSLLLLLVTGSLLVGVGQLARLFRLNDAGYPDTYILYAVQRFEQTGSIYHDLAKPPYTPAQYSPLVYIFYRLPAQIPFQNPSLGPRLAALSAFLLCVAMVISIARVLISVRAAWFWALLMATSIMSLQYWPVQLRGDFPGIFFSLGAIRFLLSRFRYRALLAGMCAGLATQFKFTFVAALVAGALWLLFRKQWKHLGLFAAGGATFSLGMYFLFWLREPRMLSQILSWGPCVRDVKGCLRLFSMAVREPLLVLALPALPVIGQRRGSGWRLLSLYIGVSFAIAGLTDIQAGGNVNYFYEGLFALVPLSVLGAFHLMAWSRANMAVAVFLTGLILIHFWPRDEEAFFVARAESNPHTIMLENQQFRRIVDSLQGRHIFSTIPRMAVLDPHPVLVEPYLMSYLQLLGKINPQAILRSVRAGEYDLVITADHRQSWRGVPFIQPDLGDAIMAAYNPYCRVEIGVAPRLSGMVVYLPRRGVEGTDLAQKLRQSGCEPYREPSAPPLVGVFSSIPEPPQDPVYSEALFRAREK